MSYNGLGLLYMNGWGTEMNTETAIYYFQQAIKKEYADAQYWIAQIYKRKGRLSIEQGGFYIHFS